MANRGQKSLLRLLPRGFHCFGSWDKGSFRSPRKSLAAGGISDIDTMRMDYYRYF